MNKKAMRYRGLSCAAWGYFFLNFDLNLGTVSILPRFAGFLFLLCAINFLLEERRDLILLRPLCIFLSVFNAVNWLLSFAGRGLDGHIIFLDLLVAAALLYFHFQFLTDIAALAQTCTKDGKKLAAHLRRSRTIYTLLSTAIAIISLIPFLTGADDTKGYSENQKDILLLLGLLGGVTALAIIVIIFRLKRNFQKEEEKEENKTIF